ncbi:MAG: 16S rRNA (adenine(1518)-N(6)/adenine(1519)-N(6))-dimethyltransferase RsmA [Helicobacter trogontum]|uniref:16S rRNA (adenine(1518)-N(6)/adenine(1519)-N(6))- dimethyltransferase RsmA n=1 Tax=Helicobacter trogontum TaxID=50960 RepID=UPI00242FAA82|nr:16S rRNA (adenine(1518)-N(6)/adenine(1519)-N(6))-dimethyltransferase RsmA [Helicobacter trogontum]MCI5787712.1 16S rRNA (adenine(1518)-N(6)/adenine(1519)-N(6))-dimethyltransferase RsmA [Helicobacter trogontum]
MQDTPKSYVTKSFALPHALGFHAKSMHHKQELGTNAQLQQTRKHAAKKHIKTQKNEPQLHHKKSLGQHFLHDSVILDRIFQSIPSDIAKQIDNDVQLIEVGIGLGDLTKRLLSKCSLLVYEIDYALIAQAQKNYHTEIETKRLQLVQADALKVQHSDGYLLNSDYFLVSNLPYYIATAIILKALKDTHCKGFLVMTQKEVAQKFCAKQKESAYCSLSILAQSFGDVSYLFSVPKEAFNPPPKVESAVFCFKRGECCYTQDLETLLHFAFLAPRKKLFTNLMQWDKIENKAMLTQIFQAVQLDNDVRAHEIGLQTYCDMLRICNAIKKDK